MKRLLTALSIVTLNLCLPPAPVAAEAPAQAPAARPLTLPQLKALLEKLKCDDVKPLKGKSGQPIGYEGQFRSNKYHFAFPIKAYLAGGGSTVWLVVSFGKVEDLEGVPAEIFQQLLAANDRIAPAFFSYSDSECELYLKLPAYGFGLTAEGLEQQLELLAESMKLTAPLWCIEAWPIKPAPTPAPKK